jgi:flavin-binding protein dodecin
MKEFDIIEKVGVSDDCFCEATKNAIKSVQKEKKIYWFEVVEQRGRVSENNKSEFQVVVKIGCR